MKRILLFVFILTILVQVNAQDIRMSYTHAEGPGTDTVKIFMENLTPSTIQIGAVNLSVVYKSSCAGFLTASSVFEDEWGSVFAFSQSSSVNTNYEAQAYDRRYQYGNTSPNFANPTTVPLPTGPAMQVMTVVFSSACPSLKRMESKLENNGNDISNENAQNIPYTIDNFAVGLPVEWLSFDAYQVSNKEIKLDWQTASEDNNAFFEIEKSEDATNFFKIGQMDGQGTTQDVSSYSFNDDSEMYTVNYYRIKQVDFDGNFAYSEVREVELNSLFVRSFSLYPNPTSGQLTLETNVREDFEYTLSITDLSGKEVFLSNISLGKEKWQKDLSELANGIYFLTLTDEESGEAKTFKFVKQ